MSFIVTMQMESDLIGESMISPISIQVIDFDTIPISKGQFAPTTFPFLLVQEPAKRGSC
jgi:hypothetical protein